MTIEDMTLPCPLDICDGLGVVEQVEEETNGVYEAKCPCTNDVDHD